MEWGLFKGGVRESLGAHMGLWGEHVGLRGYRRGYGIYGGGVGGVLTGCGVSCGALGGDTAVGKQSVGSAVGQRECRAAWLWGGGVLKVGGCSEPPPIAMGCGVQC